MDSIEGMKKKMNLQDDDLHYTTTVKDSAGNEMRLTEWRGHYVPPCSVSKYEKLDSLEIRDTDLFLAGYPKTGCHWTWEVMSMISRQEAKLSQNGKTKLFLELAQVTDVEQQPSPRILNGHLPYNLLPQQIRKKKTKIVLTVRNPKDTAVSYFHHHHITSVFTGYKNGSFQDWFSLYHSGKVDYDSYWSYYKQWDTDIKENPDHQIMVIRFEDMKEDLPASIRRLAKFMGKELSDQLILDIAKAAGFDSMKASMVNSPTNALLRKGQVGNWKNTITVAESEAIDNEVEKNLYNTIFAYQRYVI